MPIEVGFWKITGGQPARISYSTIDSEKKLEDIISSSLDILSEDLLLVGRQVPTVSGKYIDLLGIDAEGKLSVIELKRNRTPRDVVAQGLDYASWVQNLTYEEIKDLFEDHHGGKPFEEEFSDKFGTSPPEKINQEHEIIIVCSALDPETERIINYLSGNYSVPVNAVFFRYFKDNGQEYLSRSWLIDPTEVIERSSTKTKIESWNGKDFVINVDVDIDAGGNEASTWEDCIRYGFAAAGGGQWYSRTLKQLFPGARVFAMRPKKGYLGVGEVVERSVPIKDFKVELNGTTKSILDVPLQAEGIKKNADDLENCEYLVRVKWLKTVPEEQAYWEKGMIANQNSAFKLRNKFTLERLTKFFELDD
ncbi:endonuclease NucS domain-containing protein [Desulfurivibrio sp. D14AmB]|uniref:endonuclease NucS domain-containing protein n=1 Tax=Desulfurivibrio sp. D14AmB TaxID=3374370 RepID=UPI00376F38C1